MSIVKQRELTAIAERLWPVFGAPTLNARVKHLNGLLLRTSLSPRFGEGGALEWTTRERSLGRRLLAGCTATLLELVNTHGWQRLRTCSADNCQDVYADTRGRGSRRYCSHTCLNRTRVRAYRSRQRTSRETPRAVRAIR
jgi:predicted RNA-binding Zn ribbon-like protein